MRNGSSNSSACNAGVPFTGHEQLVSRETSVTGLKHDPKVTGVPGQEGIGRPKETGAITVAPAPVEDPGYIASSDQKKGPGVKLPDPVDVGSAIGALKMIRGSEPAVPVGNDEVPVGEVQQAALDILHRKGYSDEQIAELTRPDTGRGANAASATTKATTKAKATPARPAIPKDVKEEIKAAQGRDWITKEQAEDMTARASTNEGAAEVKAELDVLAQNDQTQNVPPPAFTETRGVQPRKTTETPPGEVTEPGEATFAELLDLAMRAGRGLKPSPQEHRLALLLQSILEDGVDPFGVADAELARRLGMNTGQQASGVKTRLLRKLSEVAKKHNLRPPQGAAPTDQAGFVQEPVAEAELAGSSGTEAGTGLFGSGFREIAPEPVNPFWRPNGKVESTPGTANPNKSDDFELDARTVRDQRASKAFITAGKEGDNASAEKAAAARRFEAEEEAIRMTRRRDVEAAIRRQDEYEAAMGEVEAVRAGNDYEAIREDHPELNLLPFDGLTPEQHMDFVEEYMAAAEAAEEKWGTMEPRLIGWLKQEKTYATSDDGGTQGGAQGQEFAISPVASQGAGGAETAGAADRRRATGERVPGESGEQPRSEPGAAERVGKPRAGTERRDAADEGTGTVPANEAGLGDGRKYSIADGHRPSGRLLSWLNEVFRRRANAPHMVVVPTPGEVMRKVGIYRPIHLDIEHARHIFNTHPDISPELLAALPSLLRAPRLVMARGGNYRFVVDARVDGRPVTVVLNKADQKDGPKVLKVVEVSTAFGLDESLARVAVALRAGEVKYVRQNEVARLRDLLHGESISPLTGTGYAPPGGGLDVTVASDGGDVNLTVKPPAAYTGVQYSQRRTAGTAGQDAAKLEARLKGFFNSPAFFHSKVQVVQDENDPRLPAEDRQSLAGMPGKVQGFFAEGKVWIIASNVAPGKELAVFLHEAGVHMGMENLLGPAHYTRLIRQLEMWEIDAVAGETTQEAVLITKARRRVERAKAKLAEAGEAPLTRKQEMEELLAYFVEEAVNAGVQSAANNYKSEPGRWLAEVWCPYPAASYNLK